MAGKRAIQGKKYLRLLSLASAAALLVCVSVPAFSQSVQDQIRLDDTRDRQEAERQRILQEQERQTDLNAAETERTVRDNQDEIDQRLEADRIQSELDSQRKVAEDRANYLKATESARAAAMAKQAREAEKKEAAAKKTGTPVSPPPAPVAADSASDSIIGAPSTASTSAGAPGTSSGSAADALIASPATSRLAAEEEKVINDAVAAAIAKAKADAAASANNVPAPAPTTPAPVPAAPATPAEPVKAAAADTKTPPPPMTPKAGSKKSQGVQEALNDYDAASNQELAESLPDAASKTAPLFEEDKDTPVLSLNSIVLFALDDNPDVGMAKARKQQAIHNVGRAKSALYPRVDITAEQSEEYNSPAAGTNPVNPAFSPSDRVSVILQQMIFDGRITANTIKQREQAVTGSDYDIAANTKDVLTTTVQQYLNVLKFQSTLRDNQEFIARLNDIRNIIQTTYEMGGSAKSDVEYAESRMASAESGLENVRSSLNDAMSNLQSLTGPLPEFIASAPDDLDPERVKLDEYVKLAQANNNEVLSNENDLKQMQYKLATDKGAYMPRVNFIMSGERTYDDGGYTGRDVNGKATLQLSYNLFDGFERKENIKRTQAQITEIEIKRRKIMDDLKKQLRLSYNQMVSLQTNISKTKAEISSSRALQELNRQNFEQGSVSLIELIEGEERLNNARSKLHQQESDLFLSAYKLLLQVGIMKKNFFCEQC